MATTVERKKDVDKKSTPQAASPTRAAPYPLTDLRAEMDRLFDRFSMRFPSFGTNGGLMDWEPFGAAFGKAGLAAPHVDLSETEDGYEVIAELPGLEQKDINVELKDDMLTVSGEKREEKQDKKKDYHLSERRFGSFKRSFRLPAKVNADKVSAEFTNGVLKIMLPKTAEEKQKARKISVKVG